MSFEDDYNSIQAPVSAEIKIKGSRFIADASPTEAATDAETFLASIVNAYPDATHHCYAYRVFADRNIIERSSDAGEPAGSAGAPMLTVVKGRQLLAVTVVVTRYFGGTKLGIGGLIRAYTESTQTVLDKCKIVQHIHQSIVPISFPYELTGAVMHVISEYQGQIIESKYETLTHVNVQIPLKVVDNFKKRLIDATSNRIMIEPWN